METMSKCDRLHLQRSVNLYIICTYVCEDIITLKDRPVYISYFVSAAFMCLYWGGGGGGCYGFYPHFNIGEYIFC